MKKTLFFFLMALIGIFHNGCGDNPVAPNPEPEPVIPTPPDPEGGDDDKIVPLTKIPFHKGFNLSGWLNLEQQYYNPEAYTSTDFKQLASLGIDVVRVPLNFKYFVGPAPEYRFSSEYLKAVDNAIELALSHNMYIILDQHSYGSSFSQADEALVKAGLCQLAERYKKCDDHVILELFNEPNGSYLLTRYYNFQTELLQAIREIDKKRIVVLTTPRCDYNLLDLLPEYDDKRLIYTFHFYDPILFTHQGAQWNEAPEKYVKDIPFPYDAARMPGTMPPQLRGTSLGNDFQNYASIGTAQWVCSKLQTVKDWADKRGGVPVFCGEFGALENAPTNADRCAYYKVVADKLAEMQFGWTIWQYRGDFSMFKGNGIFEKDLNTDLIRAVGLNVPDGLGGSTPDLCIYDDNIASWLTREKVGELNLAYTDQTYADSRCCIRWDIKYASSDVKLTVWPVLDLKDYVEAGAKIEMYVRSKDPINNLQIAFQQYKESATWQWRNVAYISTLQNSDASGKFVNDNEWHLVSIPLKDFFVKGCMSGDREKPSAGEEGFDWRYVNKIELRADDNGLLAGKTIFIDNIVIRK